MAMIPYTRAYENWAPTIARVLFGAQFLFAAFGKIPGTATFNFSVQYSAQHGVPLPTIAVTLAFILEVVTGLMLVFGWRARVAATVLIPYVLLLGLIFYNNFSDQMTLGLFITHIALMAGLAYVSVYGAKFLALRKD